jgi:rubrerythrin
MWRCPSCNRTLGELVGERLVVKIADRTLTFPAIADADQTCPKCGCVSVLAA